MQTYSCSRCGYHAHTGTDAVRMCYLWAHIWTVHQHMDVELEPAHSKLLLAECRAYGWWDIAPLPTFS